MIERIKLTQGYSAVVDCDDYESLSQHKWHYSKGYARKRLGMDYISMQNHILGADRSQIIDHINGNKLDNRKSNLRIATRSQNGMNRRANISVRQKYSTFKGVSWEKRYRYWFAYIRKDGKLKYLGKCNSELDAAMAYNAAAIKLFGEFARLNNL